MSDVISKRLYLLTGCSSADLSLVGAATLATDAATARKRAPRSLFTKPPKVLPVSWNYIERLERLQGMHPEVLKKQLLNGETVILDDAWLTAFENLEPTVKKHLAESERTALKEVNK